MIINIRKFEESEWECQKNKVRSSLLKEEEEEEEEEEEGKKKKKGNQKDSHPTKYKVKNNNRINK